MNRILLLPLNILPISHLLLPLNVLPISDLLLPINVLPISHLLLPLNVLPICLTCCCCYQTYLRSIIQIYSSSYSYSTQKHQEKKAKLDDQRQNGKKRSILHPTTTTQTIKRAVTRKTNTKQRRKKPIRLRSGNGSIKKSL